jgi:DNA-directed RNA polymerase subunit K/omega
MDFKESKAPKTTVTYNRKDIAEKTSNIYEAITIIAKRSEQISSNIKEELIAKLKEFETHNEGLEEIFENKEQIEISKFYERLPKATAMAVEEWLNERIYYRNPDEVTNKKD